MDGAVFDDEHSLDRILRNRDVLVDHLLGRIFLKSKQCLWKNLLVFWTWHTKNGKYNQVERKIC